MFDELADRIDDLLVVQDANRLDGEFGNLTMGLPGGCGSAFVTASLLNQIRCWHGCCEATIFRKEKATRLGTRDALPRTRRRKEKAATCPSST